MVNQTKQGGKEQNIGNGMKNYQPTHHLQVMSVEREKIKSVEEEQEGVLVAILQNTKENIKKQKIKKVKL